MPIDVEYIQFKNDGVIRRFHYEETTSNLVKSRGLLILKRMTMAYRRKLQFRFALKQVRLYRTQQLQVSLREELLKEALLPRLINRGLDYLAVGVLVPRVPIHLAIAPL